MTGFRIWVRGGIVLAALFTGTVALYAAHSEQATESHLLNAPYHVQKAMTLNVR